MTSASGANQRDLPRTATQRNARILALEPIWLLLLLPLLIFPDRFLPNPWQPWIVTAAFLFWPLRWWLQGYVLARTPVRLAGLLFLLCLPLPMLITTDPVRSWEALSYLVAGIALAVAAANMPLLQRAPVCLAWVLVAMGVGLALIGPLVITQVSIGMALLQRIQSAAGPLSAALGETINPNILANALLAIVPLSGAFVLRGGWHIGNGRTAGWLRPLLALATLLMIAVIYLSESRGALLALLVIILLLLVLRFPKLAWLTPFLAGGAILLFVSGGMGLLDSLTQATGSSATSGFDERMELWQRGLYAMQDFSFTGIGLGTYGTVIPFLYPFVMIPPNIFLPDAHNLPIQVGVDLGIPGLIMWLAMLLCLFVMMAQVLRGTRDNLRWVLAAGVTASFVGMLVAGIFAATNWGVKPAFLPWVIGALGVLVHRQYWQAEVAVQDGAPAQGKLSNEEEVAS